MLFAVQGFLKQIFGIDTDHNTHPAIEEAPAVQETSAFSIGFDWPFPSPEPPNPEYLVGEMITGVEKEGDHVFYYWEGKKRRHLRTIKGTETILARHMVWWMNGRKVPATANGLTTTCGEQKCIKLSHLALRTPNIPLGPVRPEVKAVKIPKAFQPPMPPKVKVEVKTKTKFTPEDRNKCITRKVYFQSEHSAATYVRGLNKPEVRGTGPRQYVYPCKQGCSGYHLTHVDPKKFGKKKVGAW